MAEAAYEYQERIRRLAVKIVKHYRGKGPELVKVKLDSESQITIEIKGMLSSLSEILLREGAADLVTEYWKVLRPYLERGFMDEVMVTIGSAFSYSWQLPNLEQESSTVIIQLHKTV
ncbi:MULTISPECIES: Na-translocating system protein MpsC family protein [Paenibacillus]|uniref:Na-translocating system protein MpsC family protein n=1 Tax=Paenibacillus TaxID=44249 RepID=UPI00039CE506|nr:Na-translocating system protein MpsC family protein [Paenibacillus massiliensis]